MIARAAAAFVALIFLVTLVFVGVCLAAFAIDTALTPPLGVAWAAALTAFILLVIPVVWMISVFLRPRPTPAKFFAEGSVIGAFASLAKDHPIISVATAGLFGIAEAFFKRRKK